LALRPAALLVPPLTHRLDAFARLARSYAEVGEGRTCYIGLVGIAAAIAMVLGVRRALARRRLPDPEVGLALWVLAYSIPSGINALIGLAGLTLFRATNRYTIVLSAILLLYLARAATTRLRKVGPAARVAAGVAVVLLAAWDQTPDRAQSESTMRTVATQVASDRAFVDRMAERLPPKARVFELPIMRYPEGDPVGPVFSYEHMRPYLYGHDLRFSFGNMKTQPTSAWQERCAALSVPELIQELRANGFSGILVNRRAYVDRGASLEQLIRSGGGSEPVESPLGDLAVFAIAP
jgi:hypothetical protein